MDQILLDKQPGLATSAIVGTLTLAKTGTTARTATFPDAAITVAGQNIDNAFSVAQTFAGSVPGTPSSGQVLIGGGAVKVGGTLTMSAATGTNLVVNSTSSSQTATGSNSIRTFGGIGSDGPVMCTSNILCNAEDTYIGADALGTPRLGFVKKAGAAPKLCYGNATTFAIAVSNASNIAAASTFTDKFTVGTTGIVSTLDTTDATTTSDGSVRMSGGLSVAKNIVTGQSAIFTAATAAGTTAGQLQRETNQDKMYSYANGIGGWMDKCLFSQYATVSQAGIVTDQSLASATARGTRTLPANFFKAGKVLKFRLCGRYTTDAAAGNGTIQIKLGSTVFRTSGSFAMYNSVTALPWELEGEIVCQTTGASGTVEGVAVWQHMITGTTSNYDAENLGGTAAVTIDTTASQAFDVIWTATDAGTTLTCTCFRLWEVC